MSWFTQLKNKKGSVTIEFMFLIPLFMFMALFIWQVVIAGLAVMNTQTALQDAVRVASITEDEDAAREQAYKTFGNPSSYKLSNLSIDVQNDRAVVTAKTDIDVLFMSSTISYTKTAQAPVLK
ncbi:hypothetical protein GCM10011571_24530 [Marinithermofilum abyssi]|uniref:TadE-like domain-containing protein n=1 Tax=Marinithermofilum abyssi TaxID=1571185 RepID=A0A8J2VJ28_9BACL|nr:TadE/TadG family type IV pilus assembly protein [Marinithermofilum abyssi]GGE21543.1 hypothetical protein GCM10011571_24530 [Marinithermofilum abyssi]